MGAFGSAAYWVCARLGMPPSVSAVWTLAAMLLLTGALHEDGVADTADGLGGGRTRDRKLAIMRDSRIGSYGAIALMLSLAARGSALAALAQPARVGPALIVAAALGRGAIVLLLLAAARGATGRIGRQPGRSFASRQWRPGWDLPPPCRSRLLPPVLALWAGAAAIASGAIMASIARRQLGGYTGDVLGAASVAAESVVLSLLSAVLA